LDWAKAGPMAARLAATAADASSERLVNFSMFVSPG
jgi:hypothetical protein